MKNMRGDFPILKQIVNGKPLIYFDNAATTQKPQAVIDSMVEFYSKYNSNIHRGVYSFGEKATTLYEKAREKVAAFIGARDPNEIVFVRGTTEAINLVASSWAKEHLKAGDEILITEMEHHANFLPWQYLAKKNNLVLKYIPVTAEGKLQMDALPSLLTPKTKLVSITQASNVLGTHNDVKTITKMAHAVGAKVLVDAAQSAPHQRINVQDIGCDFLAFSGHKCIAPTGIGVLYIAKELHGDMAPYQLGGGMVYEAGFDTSSFLPVPLLLEAGTPAIAQGIGLGAAIDYMNERVDFDELQKHEAKLANCVLDGLVALQGVKIVGPIDELRKNGHLVSFVIEGIHPHDIASYLDANAISVRAGHHCAQPLAKKLGIPASIRASFYGYNTLEEAEIFVDVVRALVEDPTKAMTL